MPKMKTWMFTDVSMKKGKVTQRNSCGDRKQKITIMWNKSELRAATMKCTMEIQKEGKMNIYIY